MEVPPSIREKIQLIISFGIVVICGADCVACARSLLSTEMERTTTVSIRS